MALVETDKVTVEIKAEFSGVVTQHFGAVDDTVEVGAPLYELDAEGEVTAVKAEQPKAPPAPVPKAPEPVAAASSSKAPTSRTPSIHFLGKEGWAQLRAPQPKLEPIPPNYGRPPITEAEMEALLMGGATIVPTLPY